MAEHKTVFDKNLWADLKELQSSMAIEGFILSESDLAEIENRCKNTSLLRLLPELKRKEEKEGRALADVINERLELNIVFHSDDNTA